MQSSIARLSSFVLMLFIVGTPIATRAQEASTNDRCEPVAGQTTEDATAIFFATITETRESNALLEVSKVWKGKVPKETWTFADPLLGENQAPADLIGSSFLIYGEANSSVDGYTAYPCVTQPMTIEAASALLGSGEEPRDFVPTFDTPLPEIDGSPLGVMSNAYVLIVLGLFAALGFALGSVTTYIVTVRR